MSYALQNFMSNNQDFARGYVFYVFITPFGAGGTSQDQIKYLVKSSNLPSSSITVAETNWQGNVYKLGTTQEFSDWTVSFLVDPDDAIRRTFVEWSRLIHDPESNYHGNPGNGNSGYLQDIRVMHLKHYFGTPNMEYKLIGAWPSVVGEMSLDYGAKDMATFDVTFQYQYHTIQ